MLDMANPAFAFRGLRKRYGEKVVLEGLDLVVPQGQFVAVIGKSGCGKSTLLRLLAGLEKADGGRIEQPEVGPSATRIMFQEPRLLPWERIVQNVAVGLTGIAEGHEAEARAEAILAEVGLAGRGGEWPSVLSGGQKQRVALARALIGSPRILALDEPLGALDALTRIEMQQLLERIWREKAFTAVLVTHDVSEAVLLADRVIVLEEGRVALDLSIDLPRPRHHGTHEVAAFEARILAQLFGENAV